jgi:hypothetical protein
VNGIAPNDRLYEAAATAADAMFTLRVMPNYDECEREPPSEPPAVG